MKALIILSILFPSLVNITAQNKSDLLNQRVNLKFERSIILPDVKGRIDHLSIDLQGNRLFVAALGNNSVEVINLKSGKVIHSIKNLSEPQGIEFIPGLKKLFVANGGSGKLLIFNSDSFRNMSEINLSSDADNIRYDSKNKLLYVGSGEGALNMIDVVSDKIIKSISLPAHPEAFEYENSGSNIFVNVPGKNEIEIINQNEDKITGAWKLSNARYNFPMALDEKDNRLFVGCRIPSKMFVFDTKYGKQVAGLNIAGDVDDIFYNSASKRIYLSEGDGFVEVYNQINADNYKLIDKVKTKRGARTSLLVPQQNKFYVAIPRSGNNEAEIRIYKIQN